MRWAIVMTGAVAALLWSPAGGYVWAEETEEQAIAAIKKLGGDIWRDEDEPGKPVVCVIFKILQHNKPGSRPP
jgi:hypothetical protein